MRVYLAHVKVEERGTLRALGARWDRQVALWWIDTDWPDVARFDRWDRQALSGETIRMRGEL